MAKSLSGQSETNTMIGSINYRNGTSPLHFLSSCRNKVLCNGNSYILCQSYFCYKVLMMRSSRGGRGECDKVQICECNGVHDGLTAVTLAWNARDWGLIPHWGTKLSTHCDIWVNMSLELEMCSKARGHSFFSVWVEWGGGDKCNAVPQWSSSYDTCLDCNGLGFNSPFRH